MESGYATISIGGTLRRADLDRFIAAAVGDYCRASYTDEGGHDAVLEEIEAAAEGKRDIRFYGEDVPWAEFDSLEALCRDLKLAYRRESAAIPGVGGEITAFWEPGMERPEDIASGDSALMLNLETIRRHRRDGALDDVLDRLERIEKFDVPLVLEGSAADEPTKTEAV